MDWSYDWSFIGAYLTRIIKPGYVLALFASFASVLVLTSIASQGLIAMWSILAVGLFNSIMFPTIFTLAIDGLGSLKPKASGLLCTAIVGALSYHRCLDIFQMSLDSKTLYSS